MQSGASRVPLLVSAVLLITLLYPALFLGYRVAPEASLKSFPPWRSLWGPYPNPSREAVRAATHLGPRLAAIARDGTDAALWDPWIGGGRPGWLAAPEEGGAPLPVAAALLARPGWAWTALVALELGAALLGTWWALRTLGLAEWPAAVGATAYALSGAAAGAWLSWRGSALALGPLALAVALAPVTGRRRVAAFAAALLALAASGGPAVAFVALAAAAMTLRPGPRGRVRTLERGAGRGRPGLRRRAPPGLARPRRPGEPASPKPGPSRRRRSTPGGTWSRRPPSRRGTPPGRQERACVPRRATRATSVLPC